MTFLGARTDREAWAVLLGVPYDATATFRRGSALAPAAIRWASESIETYSRVLRRDLEELRFADQGDLDVAGMTPEAMVETVRAAVGRLPAGALPVLVGGEHTLTVGAVSALAERHPNMAVLQIDAHTDLRDEYEGRPLSHATVMRRIMDVVPAERIVALGLRAGTRAEFEQIRQYRAAAPRLGISSEVWTYLADRPAYVTIDIDAVDPADAPGTGNPEPEGLPAGDLLRFVRRLGDLRVVGMDLVEVSPPYDPSGRTAVLAAVILREALLVTAPRPA